MAHQTLQRLAEAGSEKTGAGGMIFQHTWEKVLSGEKTQTRRIVKPGDFLNSGVVFNEKKHTRYAVGSTYAVQPSRTHPAIIYNPEHPCYGIDVIQPGDDHYNLAKSGVWNYQGQGYRQARIRIMEIRLEDIRQISDEDIQAEGFAHDPEEFFETWCVMHDPAILPFYTAMYRRGWLYPQPAYKYQAWVLTFCLVNNTPQTGDAK
jgi:hypothetical protein